MTGLILNVRASTEDTVEDDSASAGKRLRAASPAASSTMQKRVRAADVNLSDPDALVQAADQLLHATSVR